MVEPFNRGVARYDIGVNQRLWRGATADLDVRGGWGDGPDPVLGLTGNTKVTRQDWMKLALETLICEGVEAVRVLALGQKLNVSRSSF